MSTIDTAIRPREETNPVQESRGRSRPTASRVAAFAGAFTAITLASVTVLWGGNGDQPDAAPVVVVDQPAAYEPGGSVYEAQVPYTYDWSAGYGEGSYLYDAQVPASQ